MALYLAACSCRHDARPLNLEGMPVDPFAHQKAPLVLAFVTSECPISNQYAPVLQRLHAEFRARGVAFWLVYPSRLDTPAKIRKHLAEAGYASDMRALRDPEHALVVRAGVHTTPEVGVFRADGTLAYSGRIDDRFVAFGLSRTVAQVHDLAAALRAVLLGKAVEAARTAAVGCTISD